MFNVEAFLVAFRIAYEPPNNRGFVHTRCPFCSDTGLHLGWDGKEMVTCFRCGGHSLFDAVKRLTGSSIAETKVIIERYEVRSAAALIRARLNEVDRPKRIELIGDDLKPIHRKYLRSRGFDPDYLVEKYGIRGVSISPAEWRYRVIIPVFDRFGALISYQGRDITGRSTVRYKSLEDTKSVRNLKHVLYNIQNVRGTSIGVVEGVFDVWRMGDGFVSSFGISITDYQIRELARFRRVVFLFDSEPDAQRRARENAEKLSSFGVHTELCDLETAKDPAELTEDEADLIRRELKIGG